MHVRWITAYFDLPAASFGEEVTFWRAISGSTVSPPRGEHLEFATLEPFHGDPYLRVQRVNDGPGGMHLDLHVDSPEDAALEAQTLGATLLRRAPEGFVTLQSPAGGVFCLVPWAGESERARPIRWPDGGISIVDQLRFEVPHEVFDAEVTFWAKLTARTLDDLGGADELAINHSPRLSLQVVIGRTDSDTTRALPSIAATDVAHELSRHKDWGAVATHGSEGNDDIHVGFGEDEVPDTVEMTDPAGRPYSITARNPRTGV
ncbi:MAG: VOC family protein [Gordonia sp. (in: high G+C Gram-positive bacteria)]|uniref:VOC family protein n=1 Tax=Gordonia sp. (in: high G+C Gram-positive bacteria) TaxID=84139 RepID=UPI003C745A98